jgi:hypothetical protein
VALGGAFLGLAVPLAGCLAGSVNALDIDHRFINDIITDKCRSILYMFNDPFP